MKIRFFTVTFFLVLLCSITTFAHPGRTDSSGGHYDRSTGEYHYHHGKPAHQHDEYGRCPYDTTDDDNDTDDSDSDADNDQAPKSSSNDNVSISGETENERTSLLSNDFIILIAFFAIIITIMLLTYRICTKEKKIEYFNSSDTNFSSAENMEQESTVPKKSQKKSHSALMRVICGVIIVLLAAYSIYATYQLKRYSDALDFCVEEYVALKDKYDEFLALVEDYLDYESFLEYIEPAKQDSGDRITGEELRDNYYAIYGNDSDVEYIDRDSDPDYAEKKAYYDKQYEDSLKEYENSSNKDDDKYTAQDVDDSYKRYKFEKEYEGTSGVPFADYDGSNVYVLNTGSMRIHLPSCSSVDVIAPGNFDFSDSSIQELEEQGYSRCDNCFHD